MIDSVIDIADLAGVTLATNPLATSCLVTADGVGGTFKYLGVDGAAGVPTADEGVIVSTPPDLNGDIRIWERVFEDSVNPKWWGALGDETTDDHQAFQKAVNFASSKGRNVYVSPGKYVIGDEILLQNLPIRIIGERTGVIGRGVTLIFKSNDAGKSMINFKWSQNNDHGQFKFTSIENINCETLLADGLTTFPADQQCFTFDRGRFMNLHIKNVSFDGFSGYCMKFGDMSYSHNMTFEDIKVLECGGLFKTTKNVVPNKADLNATDVTMRNIQVDLRGPSSLLQDIVMDWHLHLEQLEIRNLSF